jgi:carboxypeptidase family protein
MHSPSSVLLTLVLSATVLGQPLAPKTFHIQGTIADPTGGVMPGVSVTFAGEKVDKTIVVNDQGTYEADLPLGEYGMVVMPLSRYRGFDGYHRIFRVEGASTVTLNITLFMRRGGCDIVVNTPRNPVSPEWQETVKDNCGGEDSFPIALEVGSMELYIRFRVRSRSGLSSTYSGWRGPQYDVPVLVGYNLCTLFADHITYDARDRTLRASGHVHFDNEASATVLSESMTIKVEDGRLIPRR